MGAERVTHVNVYEPALKETSMDTTVKVTNNEKAFIDAIQASTSETCQHTGCGCLVNENLPPDLRSGFESLLARGLAQKDAEGRLLRLENEFADGLDGLANMRQEVPPGAAFDKWEWKFDRTTLVIDDRMSDEPAV